MERIADLVHDGNHQALDANAEHLGCSRWHRVAAVWSWSSAAQGENMTDVQLVFIKDYVSKYGSAGTEKTAQVKRAALYRPQDVARCYKSLLTSGYEARLARSRTSGHPGYHSSCDQGHRESDRRAFRIKAAGAGLNYAGAERFDIGAAGLRCLLGCDADLRLPGQR